MNALGLDASAVGNHEFDQGWADLRDRVIGAAGSRNAQWDYLGANVYAKGTTDPVAARVRHRSTSTASTSASSARSPQETPSLVSPGGITRPRLRRPGRRGQPRGRELSDGDPSQRRGRRDHRRRSTRAPPSGAGRRYATEVAEGGEFAHDGDNLEPAVDVIFNGHTHQVYAWDAPVPGGAGDPSDPADRQYGEQRRPGDADRRPDDR